MATEESKYPTVERGRRVRSVEIGYSIIRVLAAANRKLSLTRIAAAAEMTASRAHSYLASYVHIGLVVQDPQTSHYGLGPAAIQLGFAALRQIDVIDVARHPMSQLQLETELIVSLSVWGDHGPTIIHKLDVDVAFPVTVRVGATVPLLTSATGRIFYAFLPELYWRSILDEELKQPENLDVLKSIDVDFIRKERISSAIRLYELIAIAAPIFKYSGDIAAVLTVFGLREKELSERYDQIVKSLEKAASKASQNLGLPNPI